MPHRFNLIKDTSKSVSVFLDVVPDFRLDKDLDPSVYMQKHWSAFYKVHPESSNSINGTFFELLFSTVLINKGILPFYYQAKAAFVPNVEYDILINTEEVGPICISLKTTLRERYKQADLEALVLKNVHRRSLAYLVTSDDIKNINKKIENGEIVSIDKAYNIDNIDELVSDLKNYKIVEPEMVRTISGKEIT
ncbi:hypothetical protein PA25_04910 [Pseudoalteromonas sp. A25]|uniref:hypothetical protein n=1 Tax=Pseudoalteromonas sp. A25 TaxID=116092 RepID=UPI001260D2B3|nr:hypothetical protein [Pseudoalteromonas sp. A25]BBN80506.1 hypothetical protein PA25_04910 [Pseudoalteromonas sp. A25]